LEKRLEKRALLNWDKIGDDVEKAIDNIEIELEDVNEDLIKILGDMEVILLDKTFKGGMKILQKDLDKMRIKIEREIIGQLRGHRLYEHENEVTIIDNTHTSDTRERTVEELKEEATAMEEAAKELRRAAKEKRKIAKKKAKNK
ncbi:MAG: hypothetical protein JKY03_04735, partial [Aureispira sp.]|nr:hypothetical protein [Aureispira sp.]